MDTEKFPTKIQDRMVILQTASDVVRFGMFAGKSISYLDLEISRYSTSVNCYGDLQVCCQSWHHRTFINTSEKFRKFFTPSRKILYSLHLDFPKDREYSLKNVPEFVCYYAFSRSPHISKIRIAVGYENHLIRDMIDIALSRNFPKLKILKWILRVPPPGLPLLSLLDDGALKEFLGLFYPKVTDNSLFKDFILQFNIKRFMIEHDKPKIFEFLLYHACLFGRNDLDEISDPIDDYVGLCISQKFFSNFGIIMKYIDHPKFNSEEYFDFLTRLSSKIPSLTYSYLLRMDNWIDEKRIYQMVLITWIYIDSFEHRCIEPASEVIRLIWCSIQNPCITFSEFKMVFEPVLNEVVTSSIYEFYSNAVGEFPIYVQPRPLQHLCRTVIRRALHGNKLWIPEAIKQTALPKSLQTYVSLEKQVRGTQEKRKLDQI